MKSSELAEKFGLILPDAHFDLRVQGFLKTDEAPVIRRNQQGSLELAMMKFSLCPNWSKEFPAPFTTYNARMEREHRGRQEKIFEVPTWKESFVSGKTCLVPVSAAIESSYFGLSAGQIIRFTLQNKSVYFVAGLWSSWLNKVTGQEIKTFTLITDDPYEFFFKHGHDRSVFVIGETAYQEWLMNQSFSPQQRFQFLKDHRVDLDWSVETDRFMKPGWEKRAPSTDEIQQIRVWKK